MLINKRIGLEIDLNFLHLIQKYVVKSKKEMFALFKKKFYI